MAFNLTFSESLPPPPQKLQNVYVHTFGGSECKGTRLTQYLTVKYWDIKMGAYLVNGINPGFGDNPPTAAGKVPRLSDGEYIEPFHIMQFVTNIINMWNKQPEPAKFVSPHEFIAWCQDNGIDTRWVTDAPEWPEYLAKQKSAKDDAGSHAEAVVIVEKTRKKLKPQERDVNEGLLLVYEIFDKYKVKYLNELPASKAWGKIISGEFTSDLIKSISDAKKSITLNGGDKLDKKSFSDKYRKRFKLPPEQ